MFGVLKGVLCNSDGLTYISCRALLDDSASCAALGGLELVEIARLLMPDWKEKINLVLHSLSLYYFQQYGSGQHSSSKSAMLSFIVWWALFASCIQVISRPFVLQVASQWTAGLNVPKKAYILHNGSDCARLTPNNGSYEHNSLSDHDMHSHIFVFALYELQGQMLNHLVETRVFLVQCWSNQSKIARGRRSNI